MGVAVVVEVVEELVAGDVAAGFDDAGEAAVGEVDGVLDAGLAFEVEGEAGAVDVDVAAAEGGEAEGVVFAGVGFVADADEGGFEEADDGGENFFAREAGEGEVLSTRSRMVGRAAPKCEHVLVLGLVAGFAPAGVVAGLLAAAGVAAGGLQVAVGDGGRSRRCPRRAG